MKRSSESGQGLVEYSLILMLIALVVIISVQIFGNTVNSMFHTVNDALTAS